MSVVSANVIEIFVTETGGVDRNREFVRIGVPCPKGDLFGTEGLQILSPANETQPVQPAVLKKWHDGSIKWLLLDFVATVSANQRVVYRLLDSATSYTSLPHPPPDLPLERGGNPLVESPPLQGEGQGGDGGLCQSSIKHNYSTPEVDNPVKITKGPEYWRVSSGTTEFIVDARQFRPFRSITVNNREVLATGGSSCLLGLEGSHLTPIVENIVAETEGPLRSILRLEGRFDSDQLTSPRFVCRIHFFAGSSHLQMELTLLNPRAATHPGGLWDLGDSGSFLFKELALQFPLADTGNRRMFCSPEPGLSSLQFETSTDGMKIYQESSGGENWNSPVHRTRDGSVRLRFNGYEISDKGEKVSAGKRATPVIWCGAGETGVSAVLPRFWQEFPKAFSINADGLKVELFPGCSPDLHELQGGEQKTSLIYLDFTASPEDLAWARSPLVAAPSPRTCKNSGVFSDLPPIPGEENVADLVDQFITADELFKKREAVDEYGWRNFGDFHADHEAVYHKGNAPFVSHYNNQYDLCGGLYRKYLATGDAQWGELASDYANHVCDIDLYHTDLDREEYSRGLFWHTDHYIDAGLSTHRSCSKEHLAVKDPRFCGGGPGAEHCYTTGLMYHYFQTGNPAFREAVITTADWVLRSLSGPATVLEVLKKSLRYLKLLRSTMNGPSPIFPRYPLTRGTGNAITACLDAHEVSGDKEFLANAEGLIRGALHPDDDIAARNLHDVESTWFYTVLMVAIAKYLNKKRELEQFDSGYDYARDSLLAYAEWMLKHEYPYLEKPEILEYPNETWAAQDLRKSVIFHYAAHYASAERVQAFTERAQYFYDAASGELARHTSSSFTRPVALILQNGWVGSTLSQNITCFSHKGIDTAKGSSGHPTPTLGFASVVSRIASELLRAVRATSIKKELAWLRIRLKA